MRIRHQLALSLCILLVFHFFSATVLSQTTCPYKIVAERWPQADSLFMQNPRWLGADGAASIDLGNGKLLWLFSDSFVSNDSSGERRKSKMIRNSVAIQHGYDPLTASINFYWNNSHSAPQSFFHQSDKYWFWTGHGIRLENNLLIFLMKMQNNKNSPLGFEGVGWTAILVENPDSIPSQWKYKYLSTAPGNRRNMIGFSQVLKSGNHVYAYATNDSSHYVYLVRWPLKKISNGNLMSMEWWTSAGWSQSEENADFLFRGQTEFSTSYFPVLKKHLLIQTNGFGSATIAFRCSEGVSGLWSELVDFYTPGEFGKKEVLIYTARIHPALKGAEMILTYNVNSMNFTTLLKDKSYYFPKFLKATIVPAK